jgi:hypothetical protein
VTRCQPRQRVERRAFVPCRRWRLRPWSRQAPYPRNPRNEHQGSTASESRRRPRSPNLWGAAFLNSPRASGLLHPPPRGASPLGGCGRPEAVVPYTRSEPTEKVLTSQMPGGGGGYASGGSLFGHPLDPTYHPRVAHSTKCFPRSVKTIRPRLESFFRQALHPALWTSFACC